MFGLGPHPQDGPRHLEEMRAENVDITESHLRSRIARDDRPSTRWCIVRGWAGRPCHTAGLWLVWGAIRCAAPFARRSPTHAVALTRENMAEGCQRLRKAPSARRFLFGGGCGGVPGRASGAGRGEVLRVRRASSGSPSSPKTTGAPDWTRRGRGAVERAWSPSEHARASRHALLATERVPRMPGGLTMRTHAQLRHAHARHSGA